MDDRITGRPVKLFCIPGGGTSAVVFMRWAKHLDRNLRLCFLEVPGRGLRINEPRIEDYDSLADDLYDQMLEKNPEGSDYMILGYCAGAILAYSVYERILEDGVKKPFHVFVAASDSPSTISYLGNVFENPVYCDEIKDFMARFFPSNTFDSLAESKKFFDRFVDAAHEKDGDVSGIDVDYFFEGVEDAGAAGKEDRDRIMDFAVQMYTRFMDDLSLFKRFECPEPRTMMDCGVTVFGGSDDVFITQHSLRNWSSFTDAKCDVKIVEGRHRFLLDEYGEVLETVNAVVADHVGSRAARKEPSGEEGCSSRKDVV